MKFLVKFLGEDCFSISPVRDKKLRYLYHFIYGEQIRRDIVVEALNGEEAEKLARARLFDICPQIDQSINEELDKCSKKLSSLQNRKIITKDEKLSEDIDHYTRRINHLKRLLYDVF